MVSSPAFVSFCAFVSLAWWYRHTPKDYCFSFHLSSSNILIIINPFSRWWQWALFHLHFSVDIALTCLVLSHKKKHGGNTLCFLTPSLGWLPKQHNIINKTGRISIPLVLQGKQQLFSCQAHILLISWQVNPKDEKGWSALLLQKQLIKAWIITMIWCTDSQRDETDLAETWQY